MFIDNDATDLERIIERMLEADIKPTVNRGIDEAQGKSIDHDHGRHREQNKGQQQTPTEARAGCLTTEIPAQRP